MEKQTQKAIYKAKGLSNKRLFDSPFFVGFIGDLSCYRLRLHAP
jgi:hypothetical protein